MRKVPSFRKHNLSRVLSRPIIVVAVTFSVLAVASAPAWAWYTLWANRTQCSDIGYSVCLWNNDSGVTSGNGVYLNYSNSGGANTFNVNNNWGDCNGTDTVQSKAFGSSTNCPFSNVKLDNDLYGEPIIAIQSTYLPQYCVGAVTYWRSGGVFDHANALWHSCPGGSGDSTYTYWVAEEDMNCGQCYWYINVRGTNELDASNGSAQELILTGNGNPGDLASLRPYYNLSEPTVDAWCPAGSVPC
jgi:hypothetical protein